MVINREKKVSVSFSEDEFEKISDVSDKIGIDIEAFIRMSVIENEKRIENADVQKVHI